MQGVFRELDREPEGLAAKTVIERVQRAMTLTPFELSPFPSTGAVRFPKILRFATIGPVKAGWMLKQGGTWTVTDEGRHAISRFPDPEAFYRESGRLYREWKAAQPVVEVDGAGQVESDDEASDTDVLDVTSLEEAQDAARQAVRDYLSKIPPYDFQDLVAELLTAMGYHVVWIAPKGRDGGLDLLAQSDALGVNGPRIKGQVKRRDDKVGEEELRAFLSLIEPDDVGVYIALSGFTREAQDLGRRTPRRLTMLDGEALFNLWIEHYARIGERGRQLLPIKAVYFLDAPVVVA